jgi:rhodanese-related sulfurtransferase
MGMNRKVTIALLCALLSSSAGIAGAADDVAVPAHEAARDIRPISQAELLARLTRKDPDLVVLDVRTPEEFAAGHVPGSRNVPLDELPARLAELSSLKDKDVVLYCRTGRRAAAAGQTLRRAGLARRALRAVQFPCRTNWLPW